jgi:hypothetical protein
MFISMFIESSLSLFFIIIIFYPAGDQLPLLLSVASSAIDHPS